MHLVLVWLPAVTAAVLWVACRSAGELTMRSGTVFAIWYGLGLYLQLSPRSPGMAVAGLVAHVVLAIGLILKLKVAGAVR